METRRAERIVLIDAIYRMVCYFCLFVRISKSNGSLGFSGPKCPCGEMCTNNRFQKVSTLCGKVGSFLSCIRFWLIEAVRKSGTVSRWRKGLGVTLPWGIAAVSHKSYCFRHWVFIFYIAGASLLSNTWEKYWTLRSFVRGRGDTGKTRVTNITISWRSATTQYRRDRERQRIPFHQSQLWSELWNTKGNFSKYFL